MNKQNGFTLIEVLIAMLVLAIGLLGLAGLQATSLRNTQSAYNRSLATQLAYDLVDRMRANVAGVAVYTSMLPSAAAAQENCLKVSTFTITCLPNVMAKNDLYEWNLAVTTSLPKGTGAITPANAVCNIAVCTITINWDDNHDGYVDAKDPNFTTRFQL
jgi:type IV pilus assembly protein PilV